MTTTFGNLVDENYQSTSSLPELTLVFMNLQDTLEIPEEILRTACSSIVQNQRLFDGKSDFLSLISIRAFELLIVWSSLSENGEFFKLKRFEVKFTAKTRVIARFVYACFLVLFFVGGVKGISHLVEMNPSLSPMLNWIGWIQGVLGLGLAGLFGAFRVKVEDVIQSTLGYKPWCAVSRVRNCSKID